MSKYKFIDIPILPRLRIILGLFYYGRQNRRFKPEIKHTGGLSVTRTKREEFNSLEFLFGKCHIAVSFVKEV